MSKALPPQKVLSQLEDQKANELTLKLAELNRRSASLMRHLEHIDSCLADVKRQREQLNQEATTILELSSLEAERQQCQERKDSVLQELEAVAVEENELRVEILMCMSKSKAYATLLESEKKKQQKYASRVEQQSIDDLMAHRRVREEQS